MQIINNTGAIIGEQINLGDIGNLNIDDLFKDDTNNKKMKNNNYPNWLVPLEIAKELKEIGFDVPTLFHYYENDFDISVETNDYYNEGEAQGYLNFYISALKEEDFNIYKIHISIPTWEQVFEWFREKGYIGTINFVYIDKNNFYYKLRINGKCNFINEEKFTNYEDTREKLINKLIETYKTNEILLEKAKPLL